MLIRFLSVLMITLLFLIDGEAAEQTGSAAVESKVGAAIRSYVAGRLASNERDIRVRLVQPPEGESAPGEVVEVREGTPNGLLGRVVFLVSFRPSGKPIGYQWVTAEVEMIRPVVVSVRSLRRSEVIKPEDLEIRSIGVVRAAGPYLADPSMLIGKRVVRAVAPGMPISLEMVETAPLIRSGDRVTLVVETGGLRIATVGKAKEEGFLGRSMAILNLDSRKTIYGEVVDASTVKVTLPE